MGGLGQFLPLAPAASVLFIGLALGAGNSAYSLVPLLLFAGAAIYKGSDIIDQPFLRYSAIGGHHQINDEQGNENSFGATYLIKEITDVVGNSAILTFHSITKFNTDKKVTKKRVTAIGTNFSMENIGSFFRKGNGELFGFDFPTNHIAPMLIREDPIETLPDDEGTRAIIYLTSLRVIDDQLKERLDKKVVAAEIKS